MKQTVYIVNASPYYSAEVFANFADAQKSVEEIAKIENWEYSEADDAYVMPNDSLLYVQTTVVK